MGYFYGAEGYYEGDRQHTDDISVPVRPGLGYIWVQNRWEFNHELWLERVIRPERNQLLSACDFTQLSDTPISAQDKALWAQYRQELRDFPEDANPENVVWPTPPVI